MESLLFWSAALVTKIIAKIGYWGIMFLMAVESSFIPFPSEIVIPPAAYLAHQGKMNIYLVVLVGIIGSLLGALVNYFLAYTLGRKIIYSLTQTKLAKVLLINQAKIEKAEKYFLNYGNLSTFVSRLIPAIRQLISLPAGFSRMNLGSFLFYTFLGSGIWVSILAALGYYFGANQELFNGYYQQISWLLIIVAAIIVLGLIIKKMIKK
ncbi:MAG: DedA family protein [Patescibacteria group bacterium]